MVSRLLIIVLLLSLVGCKSTYKANSKSELAKLCLAEFPLDNVPIETKTDTITVTKTEWLEVDCDTIGKKQVPHECEVKTVTKTKVVQDSRQTYLIQNLEGRLELELLHKEQLEATYKDNLSNKDKQHKEEIKSLETKYNNETDSLRKDRNKWRWIVILIGVVLGIGVIRKLKII